MDKEKSLAQLHAALGMKRLSRGWAKIEILLGLTAVAIGMTLLHLSDFMFIAAGVLLFVFGGYLALAGHRSHLYQSNNELAAYIVEQNRGK